MYEKLEEAFIQRERNRLDEIAEREAAAISLHRVEHRSVFCPNHFMARRSDQLSLAEQLGVSMAGVVSYVRRMNS